MRAVVDPCQGCVPGSRLNALPTLGHSWQSLAPSDCVCTSCRWLALPLIFAKLWGGRVRACLQINAAPARGPDHFPFQGFRESGIGSQGIKNSLEMMIKTKSTVINLPAPSYQMG